MYVNFIHYQILNCLILVNDNENDDSNLLIEEVTESTINEINGFRSFLESGIRSTIKSYATNDRRRNERKGNQQFQHY
jgi:hypothetical protein